jgi:hypothetical protein
MAAELVDELDGFTDSRSKGMSTQWQLNTVNDGLDAVDLVAVEHC